MSGRSTTEQHLTPCKNEDTYNMHIFIYVCSHIQVYLLFYVCLFVFVCFCLFLFVFLPWPRIWVLQYWGNILLVGSFYEVDHVGQISRTILREPSISVVDLKRERKNNILFVDVFSQFHDTLDLMGKQIIKEAHCLIPNQRNSRKLVRYSCYMV